MKWSIIYDKNMEHEEHHLFFRRSPRSFYLRWTIAQVTAGSLPALINPLSGGAWVRLIIFPNYRSTLWHYHIIYAYNQRQKIASADGPPYPSPTYEGRLVVGNDKGPPPWSIELKRTLPLWVGNGQALMSCRVFHHVC